MQRSAISVVVAGLVLGGVQVLAPPPATGAPAEAPDQTYVTDGRVNAVVRSGDRIYLGGSFTLVGPNTGHGLPVATADGTRALTAARINGAVLAAAPDGLGGWYVGGLFSKVGDSSQINAAHIRADGTLDPRWTPRPGGAVRAIAYSPGQSTVYLGGDFTTMKGVAAPWLAGVDASLGALRTGFKPGLNGAVHALALDAARGRLVVGGAFTSVHAVARSRVTVVSASTGALTGPVTPFANSTVRALSLSADGVTIHVGGAFTTLGGIARVGVGAFSGTTGAVLSFNGRLNGSVNALLRSADGSRLYVGGQFTTVGGVSAPLLTAVSPSTGARVTGFNPGLAVTCTNPDPDHLCTAAVHAVTRGAGSNIRAGGWYTTVGGVGRANVAELTATGAPTAWSPVANGRVRTLAPGTGTVFTGGDFTSVNATPRANLAAIDATTGAVDDAWRADTDAQVFAVEGSADGASIYAGGSFKYVAGKRRSKLAKLSTTTGQPDPAFDVRVSSVVYALARSANRLYLGGNFGYVGTAAVGRTAAVDATTGALDPAFHGNANEKVTSLAVSPNGTAVWAGGYFTAIGGRTISNVAKLSPVTGNAFAWTPTYRPTSALDLATNGTTTCVGTSGHGTGGNSAICYDAATAALRWYIRGDGDVQAITMTPTTVYVGGHFNSVTAASTAYARRKLAAFTLGTGAIQTWAPSGNSALGVFALAPESSGLLVGGDFTAISDASQQGFARLSGTP